MNTIKAVNKPIRTLAVTLGLVLGTAVISSVLDSTPVFAAEKDPKKVSEKVGKPLKAAQEAIGKKQFDVALAEIKKAEAVEKKTPFEEFQINEFMAFYFMSQKKYDEVAPLYEKSLETPDFLDAEAADLRVKQLASIFFQSKQYPKVLEYSKRWAKAHPNDIDASIMMANTYYLTKDFKQCRETLQGVIAQTEKAGDAPKEIWLQLVNSSSSELDDSAGVVAALEKLVRYYPKPDYWDRLLDRVARNERSDRVMFQWFRLMFDVGVLKRDDQYMEYAQLGTDQAMPGEALRAVGAGFEKKILGVDEKNKERHQRLLATVKQKAQADRNQLAQIEKEAQASNATTGGLEAGLGLAYFSNEMYDQAIQSLEKAIKKGGLKNLDEDRLTLGVAQLRKGQKETARSTFKTVPADSPLAKVAEMWVLRTYN